MKRSQITQQVRFLYTDDLEKRSAFYRDVIELKLALDQGACHIYHLSPTSFITICTF